MKKTKTWFHDRGYKSPKVNLSNKTISILSIAFGYEGINKTNETLSFSNWAFTSKE